MKAKDNNDILGIHYESIPASILVLFLKLNLHEMGCHID